jgi:hypothetical protein
MFDQTLLKACRIMVRAEPLRTFKASIHRLASVVSGRAHLFFNLLKRRGLPVGSGGNACSVRSIDRVCVKVESVRLTGVDENSPTPFSDW